MKIGGPKGSGPIKPPEPDTVDKPAKAGESRFDCLVESKAVGESRPSEGAASAVGTGYEGHLQQVVARLRAGELSPTEAREALVDAVVKARGSTLSPEQRAKLAAALSGLLREDPYLTGQLASLGGAVDG
jgi:hypothetical protein